MSWTKPDRPVDYAFAPHTSVISFPGFRVETVVRPCLHRWRYQLPLLFAVFYSITSAYWQSLCWCHFFSNFVTLAITTSSLVKRIFLRFCRPSNVAHVLYSVAQQYVVFVASLNSLPDLIICDIVCSWSVELFSASNCSAALRFITVSWVTDCVQSTGIHNPTGIAKL